MGQTANELRRDIEGTRDHLGYTMDAIEQKVSPRAMVDRRRTAMAERWSAVRTSVMGVADDVGSGTRGAVRGTVDTIEAGPSAVAQRAQGNPLAAGLIAFGTGLLASTLFPVSRVERESASSLVDMAQPVVEEAKQVASQLASEVKEEGMHHAADLRDEATAAAEQVADVTRSAAEETREAGTSAAEDIRSQGASPSQAAQPSPAPPLSSPPSSF